MNLDVARISSKKAELLCSICNKIVREPIYLPCHCTICHAHLKDDSVKNGLIKCLTCDDEFVVKIGEHKVNKFAKMLLDAEDYLSSEEKELKQQIGHLFEHIAQLHAQLKQEQTEFELKSHEHFAEIKRKVDIQREELKAKIDEIYLTMIKQIEGQELAINAKLVKSRQITQSFNTVDLQIDEEFRKLYLNMDRIQHLKTDKEASIQNIQAELQSLKQTQHQLEKSCFVPEKSFSKYSFGRLNLNEAARHLVSGSHDNPVDTKSM